jgi:hypothetical protein
LILGRFDLVASILTFVHFPLSGHKSQWQTKMFSENWFSNLNSVMSRVRTHRVLDRPSSKARAHLGFVNSYLTQRQRVQELLLAAHARCIQSGWQCSSLLITGHSRGGALAVLAASYVVDLQRDLLRFIRTVDVLTFGAPAVGNLAFVQYLQDNACSNGGIIRTMTHFVTREDPVAQSHLTLWFSPSGYQQVGNVVVQVSICTRVLVPPLTAQSSLLCRKIPVSTISTFAMPMMSNVSFGLVYGWTNV